MGIIRKQSISGTIYSYIGVLLGFVITAVLYTKVLSTEEVGLLRVLVSYSTLFAQFAGLGFTIVTVKTFPYFRDLSKKHHGFLGLALLVSLVGFLISIGIYLMFRPYVVEQAQEKSELFITYFYYVIPLIFFTLIFNVFDTYYRVLYNAVKGIMVKEIIQRITILVVILLYFFGLFDFHTVVILYVLAMIIPTFILLISLIRSKQLFLKPDFKFIDRKLRNEMLSVGLFGILTSYSGVLVLNIDILMINDMIGLSAAGIYSITFYFGTLILIPLRTMGKIGSVVIADALKINDLQTVDIIYKKSSLSLSVLGILLFIGIWGNIDNVFQIINDDYLSGKMVIFYIGIANLLDIALGISPQIIANSKYYKYISLFQLIFVTIIVSMNFVLIPEFGIVGAAISALIAKFIHNLIKYVFLYKKFGFQPFSVKYIYLIIIAFVAYGISTLIPAFPNYIIDIIIRSGIIFLLFIIPVYFLNISDDINERIKNIFMKLNLL